MVITNCLVTLVKLSSSNHCWVSFSGFAETYNDTYEDEVKQYGCIIDEDDEIEGKLIVWSTQGTY